MRGQPVELTPTDVGVFGVRVPACRVVESVLADALHGPFVAHYAFVVVALPDPQARGVWYAVDAATGHRSRVANDGIQKASWGAVWP
jgi:hypothetical protein